MMFDAIKDIESCSPVCQSNCHQAQCTTQAFMHNNGGRMRCQYMLVKLPSANKVNIKTLQPNTRL